MENASLHPLRRCLLSSFVRRLRRYYPSVRLPLPVHHRRTPFGFPTRPCLHRADKGSPGSRARCFCACIGTGVRKVVSGASSQRLVGIRVLCGFPQPPSSSAEKIVSGCCRMKVFTAVGAVGTVGKPARFLRRLFQAACGNHQEEIAEGLLCRFPQLRQFPQRSAFPSWEVLTRFVSSKSEAPGCNPRLRSVSSTNFT